MNNSAAPTDSKPVIELSDISKAYHLGEIEVPALHDINLTIKAGEFVAMAGPSGSGKTTLLNIIGALDDPSSGQVLVNSQDTSRFNNSQKSELRRMQIGYIFQHYNLIPVLTALENTEYVLMLQGREKSDRRDIAMHLLKEVGLQGKEHHLPSQLSGGQQQRVAIARAIAPEPRLILADEPTANVDSNTAEGLLDLMEQLNQEKGSTFLFSTHDVTVMKRSRRLIWLKDGAIDYDGNPSGFSLT